MAENKPRQIALFTALIASAVIVITVVVTVVITAVPAPLSEIAPSSGLADGGPVAGSPVDVAQAPATPSARACDYADLVGQKAAAIDKAHFGEHPFRILTPDMMVTMEYLEGRVNLHVNAQGIVTSVTCG